MRGRFMRCSTRRSGLTAFIAKDISSVPDYFYTAYGNP
jgi:hypothetical protein